MPSRVPSAAGSRPEAGPPGAQGAGPAPPPPAAAPSSRRAVEACPLLAAARGGGSPPENNQRLQLPSASHQTGQGAEWNPLPKETNPLGCPRARPDL